MVVFLQASLHAVEAIKLEETCAHKLLCAFVCAHSDISGLDFCEMFLNLFFGSGVREVA